MNSPKSGHCLYLQAMSTLLLRQLRVLLALIAVLAASCGGDSSEPAETTSSDDAAVTDAASDSDDEPAAEADASASEVDFEVFSSDEGAGCSVYVAVPEGVVDGSTDVRGLLWDGVVSSGFTTCGFSDVVEAGLITVGALDSYGQPDWSTVTEHGFFGVDGWNDLLDSCGTAPLADTCSDQVNATLTP